MINCAALQGSSTIIASSFSTAVPGCASIAIHTLLPEALKVAITSSIVFAPRFLRSPRILRSFPVRSTLLVLSISLPRAFTFAPLAEDPTCKTGSSKSSLRGTAMSSFRKVPDSSLFVSEPNPMWFGNGANEKGNSNWTNQNWLKSRFHFSFAEYTNPSNSNFGVLRVMNDDLVQPARGFGEHPHREMEICTYVVEGDLTHQDSMGNGESLGRGSIQFMTAGTGVMHQEHNKHPTNPLRFIQMWIVPSSRGLKPNYGSMRGEDTKEARQNAWAHLVSDVKNAGVSTPVKINQDANLFATELEAAKSLPLKLNADRQAYLLCIEGSIEVSGDSVKESLSRHDAAEVVGPVDVQVTAGPKGAHLLYVEMKGQGEDSRFKGGARLG